MKNLTSLAAVAGVGIGLGGAFGCGGGNASAPPATTGAVVPAATSRAETAESGEGIAMVSVRLQHLDPSALKTAMVLTAKHLEPPSNFAPDARVYVVWVRPPGGDLENVGALTVGDDGTGTLDAVVPTGDFKIRVTPETSATVLRPTNDPIPIGVEPTE